MYLHTHFITSNAISTCPDKIDAIKNMPKHQIVKQLISFIQTCAWYRRFINNFPAVVKSPNRFIQEKCCSNWGAEQQAAYDQLKRLLTKKPILPHVPVIELLFCY